MFKLIWNIIENKAIGIRAKRYTFLSVNTLIWCAIGYLGWECIGDPLLKGDLMAFCFVGYLGLFIGLFGSIMHLYRHDFS